jgi:transposase
LAQNAIDAVRRRVQQEQTGHRGRTTDPLYRVRRVLLRGAENLTHRAYARLLAGLDAGDPDGHVAAAWIAAQQLRHVYAAPDLDRARRRLHAFYTACAHPDIPELTRLGRTISSWQTQLLAYFTTDRTSNGPTEAVNLLIKRIKRVGFGFRNFDNYRLRLLLHCGVTWHTTPTARIRSHSPRSARIHRWVIRRSPDHVVRLGEGVFRYWACGGRRSAGFSGSSGSGGWVRLRGRVRGRGGGAAR